MSVHEARHYHLSAEVNIAILNVGADAAALDDGHYGSSGGVHRYRDVFSKGLCPRVEEERRMDGKILACHFFRFSRVN